MKKKNLLIILGCFLFSPIAFSQTWDGSASTDWNTPANWSTNAVPLATGSVIVPGSLTNYPKLANNVTVNRIDMQVGSQLDFNGFNLTITNVSPNYTYFTGATLLNSNAATDIIVSITTTAGYHTYMRSTTVNDNVTFNIDGPANLYEADNTGTGNHFMGNLTVNFASPGALYMSNTDTSFYDGNLTISRTVAGLTDVFNNGGVVGGNLSYINNTAGSSLFGISNRRTSIGGTVSIAVNNTTPGSFEMIRLINQTPGGSINVQNSLGFDLRNDTLTINSLSITGYRGADYGYLFNNDITGNVTISDNSTHSSGYHTYIRANEITGTASFTNNSTTNIYEADVTGGGNHYTSNVSFTATNTGSLYISQDDTSRYDGNLIINRTGAGLTDAFNSGGVVGGNFAFTNNTAGNSLFGISSKRTSVGGTINIAINDTTPGSFELIRLINQTAGGSINVQNTRGFDLRNDTLIVSSLSITGYRGADYGYLFNNDITGNVTISDNSTHTPGYHTYIRANEIKGTASFTNNSTTNIYEADVAGAGNHYTGNVNFTVTGTGSLYISQDDTSRYDGNLIINRTGAGLTDAFKSGGVIGGNFAFTNNTAGNSLFGTGSKRTSINGTINIAISDTTPGIFELIRLINQTAGGSINVQNSRGFALLNDTLIVSSLSITGYRGAEYGYLHNNDITGNVTIADDATHTSGYHTYIRANEITGTASFTNNSTTNIYEADVSISGNHYTGNVNFTANGTGSLYISQDDTSRYDGNLIINRTGAGLTDAFNSGGLVGGNFAFTNNTAGNSLFGIASRRTVIGGTVNIAINDTTPGSFEMIRIINQTAGGSINVQNTRGFTLQNDTLIVSSLSITGYRGADYGYLYNNDITGDITIADNSAHTAGYHTYIRSNEITGNASFATNSTTNIYEADVAGSGNYYSGNASFATSGATIYVGQDDTTTIGRNLTLNSSANIIISKIKFSGSSDGAIEQLGSQPINISLLIMEKSGTGKIILNDSVIVTSSLFFNGGNIVSSSTNKLIFPDNATHTGASNTSHVFGYVSKAGNDAFTFPVGTLTTLNAVAMTAPAAGSEFSAQYFASNPSAIGDTALRATTLERISGCEYWNVKREIGPSNVSLTFGFGDPCATSSPVYITNPAQVHIAHWTGSLWEDLGNGGSTGTTSGTIATAAAVSNINSTNFFSFGTTNLIANPLPVQLISFTAIKQQGTVSLQWKTTDEVNFSSFELQKSKDGINYSGIATVKAHNMPGVHIYQKDDLSPFAGVNYYRLKMVDVDEQFKFSNTLQLTFSSNRGITIFPNPASSKIKIVSSKKIMSVEITDISGKLVKRMPVNSDNSYLVNDLKRGVYFIKVTDEEKTNISKLFIQ